MVFQNSYFKQVSYFVKTNNKSGNYCKEHMDQGHNEKTYANVCIDMSPFPLFSDVCINRIKQEKYFSSKIMQKMRQGDQFQTSLFSKKAFISRYKVKASGSQLGLTMSRQPSNQHTTKANCKKLWTIDPELYSILISQKRA